MQTQEDEYGTGRQRRREEINKLLGDYRSSGLGRLEWCAINNIKVGTLAYWLKRDRVERKGIRLKEVKLAPARKSALCLMAGGAEFEVSAGSDMALLSNLLRALSQK